MQTTSGNLFVNSFNYPLFKSGSSEISLRSILTAILLLAAVMLISRGLSGLLKRYLLVKAGMEPGSREAISTIIGYTVGTLGFVIVLQTAGINLSSFTVLAGGLGIGLGFGLQELAKNFISGVTLLFEQPIKAGDFVEVDGLAGTVQKISIRSTTIRTNDGISVIVPNLNFVINKIINWSHQGSQCRVHIPVGIISESDLILVTETLLTAAHTEARILSEPTPEVRLLDFGSGAIALDLLVWIDSPKDKDKIISSLRFTLQYEFKQRNIQTVSNRSNLALKVPDPLPNSLAAALRHSPSHGMESNGTVGNGTEPTQQTSTPKLASRPDLRQLLRQVAYFETFTDLELLRLIEQGYRQIWAANEVIFHENELGNSFYIILSGSVDVFSEKANKHLTTLHAGDFFGELSLLLGIPRSATVQTVEETVLFVVPRSGLQKLLSQYRGLAERIAQKLAERQQELTQRQELLKQLGLMDEIDPEQNPLVWIRKHLQTLFDL